MARKGRYFKKYSHIANKDKEVEYKLFELRSWQKKIIAVLKFIKDKIDYIKYSFIVEPEERRKKNNF